VYLVRRVDADKVEVAVEVITHRRKGLAVRRRHQDDRRTHVEAVALLDDLAAAPPGRGMLLNARHAVPGPRQPPRGRDAPETRADDNRGRRAPSGLCPSNPFLSIGHLSANRTNWFQKQFLSVFPHELIPVAMPLSRRSVMSQ
jgi:hypothetical protein